MLNKLLIGAALALALAACASTPSAPGAANPAVAKALPPGCVGNAGSAIVRPADSPQPCGGLGNVYTRDDLDLHAPGATTVGGALRQLDPTVSVRGP
jgi:hypothetical protein